MSEIFFQCPAVAKNNGMKSMADGGYDLTFATRELTPAEVAAFAFVKGKSGQLAFITRETPLTDSDLDGIDVPESSPEYRGEKSPAQRQRAVIFRYWEQRGGRDKLGDFEAFYRIQIERIIDQYKDKLT